MRSLKDLFGELSPDEMLSFTVVFLLIACGLLVMFIFLLTTMQRVLEQVSPGNRKLRPAQVWLMLIPYFSLGWVFLVVMRISESVGLEFRKRNIESFEEKPGFALGLVWGFAGVVAFLLSFAGIWSLYIFALFTQTICWIIFWIKYRRILSDLQETAVMPAEMQQPYPDPDAFYSNPAYNNYYMQPNVAPPPAPTDFLNNFVPPPPSGPPHESRWAPKRPPKEDDHVS